VDTRAAERSPKRIPQMGVDEFPIQRVPEWGKQQIMQQLGKIREMKIPRKGV